MADPASLEDLNGILVLSLLSPDGGGNQAVWPKAIESLSAIVGGSSSKAGPLAAQYEADEGELLASVARTANAQSPDQKNHGWSGVLIVVDVTAHTATPSVTPSLEYKEPITGDYIEIATFTPITDVTDTGKYLYHITPKSTPAPDWSEAVQAEESEIDVHLPSTWRWVMTHGDGDSITYSVSYGYFRS